MKAFCSIVLTAGFTLAAGSAQAVTCYNNLPASNPDIVYVDNGDGTATDLRRGLMWKRCVEGKSDGGCTGTATTLPWATAQASAQASTFAGYSDWRLPNIRELQSLVEDCRIDPAINQGYFPNDPNDPVSFVWSGSPVVGDSEFARGVRFSDGLVGGDFRANGNHVRLVRGGQSFGDLIFENGFE